MFAAGTPIAPAQTGVLASVGAAVVNVHRRPRVAVLGSGNELVDLDRFAEAADGRRIVASNNYSLHALIRSAGAIPVNLGIAPDTPDGLRAMVSRSTGCDLLITTGGVSVGEFDYTRDVLTGLGADMKFWRVRMRPGAPLGFGWLGREAMDRSPRKSGVDHGDIRAVRAPGHPAHAGHLRLFRQPVPVVLAEPVQIHAPLTHFLRVIVRIGNGGVATARLTGPQGSGILTSMSLANALLVVPEDRPAVEAGEVLHALLLSDDAMTSTAFAL